MATKSRNRTEPKDRMLVKKGDNSEVVLINDHSDELDSFSYEMIENEETRNLLISYEGEIRSIIRQSLENVVRLGEIFTTIKSDLLPYRQWKAWVTYQFKGEIHVSTTHNWMNVYEIYKKYGEKYENALEQVSLRDLYVLGRSGVEADAKEVALELVEESKVSPKETKKVVETYRKIKLANAGVDSEIIKMLTKVDVAENPKYVQDIQKLSKKKQQEVAELLMTKQAASPKEALKLIKESNKEVADVVSDTEVTNAVDIHPTEEVIIKNITNNYSNLSDVPYESINLAIVEAPLKFEFVSSPEFYNLTKDLGNILVPSGFALITVGHKAAMYCGNALHDSIKPIHLVCLRRQPGNTCTIIGLNIASASVYMILAYKPPYRAPKGCLVADLHTLTDTEALPGMDIVKTGLEKSFERLIEPLLSSQNEEEDYTVLHHVVKDSQHFKINPYLQKISFSLGAKKFVSVL